MLLGCARGGALEVRERVLRVAALAVERRRGEQRLDGNLFGARRDHALERFEQRRRAALARERGESRVELGGVRSRLDAAADPGPRRARVVQLALLDLGELERDRRAFGVRGRDREAARLEQREAHPVALRARAVDQRGQRGGFERVGEQRAAPSHDLLVIAVTARGFRRNPFRAVHLERQVPASPSKSVHPVSTDARVGLDPDRLCERSAIHHPFR